jgi:hypothetical protein
MPATNKNYHGILGPLIHPELYPRDVRVAADEIGFARYIAHLVRARPELIDRFFFDDERLTMH